MIKLWNNLPPDALGTTLERFVLVIAWVAVEFGINTMSVALKNG